MNPIDKMAVTQEWMMMSQFQKMTATYNKKMKIAHSQADDNPETYDHED
jgi:hypothetical protein